RVRVSGQEFTAVHAIDWAADRKYPGVGTWLLRQVAAKVRMMVAIDGSDIARRIFPAIGFRPQGELCQFVRSVRPLAQAWTAAVVAASQKRVYEVSAWASTALGKEGLSRDGFLLRARSAVSLFGDARILEGRELHLQMLDSDASSCMGKPCPPRTIYTT